MKSHPPGSMGCIYGSLLHVRPSGLVSFGLEVGRLIEVRLLSVDECFAGQ